MMNLAQLIPVQNRFPAFAGYFEIMRTQVYFMWKLAHAASALPRGQKLSQYLCVCNGFREHLSVTLSHSLR